MSALLTSLPGDIPGLLRRWSPVIQRWSIDDGESFTIEGVAVENVTEAGDPDMRWLCWFTDPRVGCDNRAAMFLHLDLTDPTGRWHAAVWAEQAATYADVMEALRHVEHAFYVDAIDAICRAKAARTMTPEQVNTLAHLVLHLAGKPTA